MVKDPFPSFSVVRSEDLAKSVIGMPYPADQLMSGWRYQGKIRYIRTEPGKVLRFDKKSNLVGATTSSIARWLLMEGTSGC